MGGAASATDEIITIDEDDEGGTREAHMRADTAPPRRGRRRFARRICSRESGRRPPRAPPKDWKVHDELWEFLSRPVDITVLRDIA